MAMITRVLNAIDAAAGVFNYEVAGDPTQAPGCPATIGSTAVRYDGGAVSDGTKYVKTGAGDTQWSVLTDPSGNASNLKATTLYQPTLTPAQVAANTTAEQIFAVPGVTVTDVIVVNKPTAQAGLGIVGARVSSVGNVAITFSNNTGAGITPTAGEVYSVLALTF